MGILDWVRRGPRPASPGVVLTNTVKFDETWVVHHRGDGSLEELAWPDLQLVQVRVCSPGGGEDEGPAEAGPEPPGKAPDAPRELHWVLVGKAGRCEIPFETEGCDELYERLQTLDDFNVGAVGEAREAEPPAEFLCWIRGAA